MKKHFQLFALVCLALTAYTSTAAWAGGLVINAAEVGIGKFHRYDNQQHPYAADNAWSVFILPTQADLTQSPIVVPQRNGSITVFFSSLEELFTTIASLSQKTGQKVDVININAHGLPGGMWFPKNAAERESSACRSWVDAAKGSDVDNYNQYYSPVSKSEIMTIRTYAKLGFGSLAGCTTTLKVWQEIAAKVPAFKAVLASDVQIHLLSCVVGLGKVGDNYTKGLSQLLLTSDQARIETSTYFGLGDWSMPEGMGFWDYQTDAQLDHDNAIYPKDKEDREIMQKGIIRVATVDSKGQPTSGLLTDRDFMFLDQRSLKDPIQHIASTEGEAGGAAGGPLFTAKSIRIPGTNVSVELK